jgi:hypothetical protein
LQYTDHNGVLVDFELNHEHEQKAETKQDRVYNIYLFSSDRWMKIASVKNQSVKNLTPLTLPYSVYLTNQKIFEQIVELQENPSINAIKSFTNEYPEDLIDLVLLRTLKYRRCTIYIMLQFSHETQKSRIMAYGIDWVFHMGFGTSLELVGKEDLISKINEITEGSLNQYKSILDPRAYKSLVNKTYLLFI